MSYTYYLLTLVDGSQITVPELPDFESWEPVAGDDVNPPAVVYHRGESAPDVDAKTVWFIPRHVVSYRIK